MGWVGDSVFHILKFSICYFFVRFFFAFFINRLRNNNISFKKKITLLIKIHFWYCTIQYDSLKSYSSNLFQLVESMFKIVLKITFLIIILFFYSNIFLALKLFLFGEKYWYMSLNEIHHQERNSFLVHKKGKNWLIFL